MEPEIRIGRRGSRSETTYGTIPKRAQSTKG